jgi:plastocyanin
MKKSLVAVIVLILVVLAAGAYGLTRNAKPAAVDTTTSTVEDTPDASSTAETTAPAEQTSEHVITYSNSGFSPSKITLNAGDTITIKNTSSKTLDFDSDPHPVHTDDRELNIGTVEPGETKTAKLTTKGTWGYHNHLNSTETGTIVVQ